MKVLVLHAYSAANAGDGLLVRETLGLLREALGADVEVTVAASHPRTFDNLGVLVLDSQPRRTGWDRQYLAALRRVREPDLVLAVGGGYQRAGHPLEALKFALVHGPQLWAAARRGRGVVYLPQSIGPLRGGTRRLVAGRLRRVEHVLVRDDRSLAELAGAGVVRAPDLALVSSDVRDRSGEVPVERPVLSVRAVRGVLPDGATAVAAGLGAFDGYVQSTTAGNDDTAATAEVPAARLLDRAELLTDPAAPRRVVVAVRLHAALMALNAGHLVVHMSYERKGFGAFGDLGLDPWVHNVFDLDAAAVVAQVRALATDPDARADYEQRVAAARAAMVARREELVGLLRNAARVRARVSS